MKAAMLEPRKLSNAASAHLDLIRAAASWAVMWGHLRTLFFVDFQHLPQPGWLLKGLYFITGFGHQAVMVFFVLSGYLISMTVFKNYLLGNWSLLEYTINRAVRLYVVLIPGLLLGLVWDLVGSSLFASTGIYLHPIRDLGSGIPANNISTGCFFCNLFFFQTILCSPFGSNGPLWSLANEFWYYVLFPTAFFAGLAWTKRSMPAAIALTVIAICLGILLRAEKLIGFLIWMSGCVLVFVHARFKLRARRWQVLYFLTSALVLLGCLVAARTSNANVLSSDLAVGIAFAFFLSGFLQLEMCANSPRYSGAAHLFAGFSYSLYVLHFPLLLLLRTWLVPAQRWEPNAVHLAYAILVGSMMLSFAWLVSLFTENRTHTARDWVRRVLSANR
jgi:peptidoglycan/LPS O-acetylase OafA/YrhL